MEMTRPEEATHMTTPVNTFVTLETGDPRTIEWSTSSGPTQMMSEIGEGVFAAWLIQDVDSAGLPIEPDYIARWRESHRQVKASQVKSNPVPSAPKTTAEPPPQGDNTDVGF